MVRTTAQLKDKWVRSWSIATQIRLSKIQQFPAKIQHLSFAQRELHPGIRSHCAELSIRYSNRPCLARNLHVNVSRTPRHAGAFNVPPWSNTFNREGMAIMKKILAIALALFAAGAIAQQTGESQAATPAKKFKASVLTRAQFDALLAKPKELLIIDVRRPDELTAKGGFPVYLSIQAKQLEKSLAFIPKDRTIVTVSNHAARAGLAADLLTGKGFKVAGAVGVEGYAAEGGEVTRIVPPDPAPAPAPAQPPAAPVKP